MKNPFVLPSFIVLVCLHFCVPLTSHAQYANNALSFSGPTASAIAPKLPSDPNRGFTWECWAIIIDVPGNLLCYAGDVTQGQVYPTMWIDERVTPVIVFSSPAGQGFQVISKRALSIQEWHHVAATYDRTTIAIYIDGDLVASEPYADGCQVNTSLHIGALDGQMARLAGEIDELRIWNRALTQQELKSHMNQELDGNEAGLVTYYKFNEPEKTRSLIDYSPSGNEW